MWKRRDSPSPETGGQKVKLGVAVDKPAFLLQGRGHGELVPRALASDQAVDQRRRRLPRARSFGVA